MRQFTLAACFLAREACHAGSNGLDRHARMPELDQVLEVHFYCHRGEPHKEKDGETDLVYLYQCV